MFNRKLLEKQRVENHFASYEVHIDHFFDNANATVSLEIIEPCLYWDLKTFYRTDELTNWQTERQTKPIADRHITLIGRMQNNDRCINYAIMI